MEFNEVYGQFKLLLQALQSKWVIQESLKYFDEMPLDDYKKIYRKVLTSGGKYNTEKFVKLNKKLNLNILAYSLKDITQLECFLSADEPDQDEIKDSLKDAWGWFCVYKIAQPSITFESVSVTSVDLDKYLKRIDKLANYYHSNNKELRALGLYLEDFLKDILLAKGSNTFNYDILLGNKRIDIKLTTQSKYFLPEHRFNFNYDYILFCTANPQEGGWVINYNQIVDKYYLQMVADYYYARKRKQGYYVIPMLGGEINANANANASR